MPHGMKGVPGRWRYAWAVALIFAGVSAGSLIVQELDYRNIEDQLHRSVTTADNLSRVRTLLSRSYLAARSSEVGDPTFDPAESVQHLEEAASLLNDWASGRTGLHGFRAESNMARDRLAAEYRDHILAFRDVLAAGDPDPVMLRVSFSGLERAADALEFRIHGLLREELAAAERRHAWSVAAWSALLLLAAAGLWRVNRSHHAAQRAQRAAERQRSALLEAMRDVVIVLDETGTYLDIPASGSDGLLRPPSELQGRRVDDVLPGREADTVLTAVRQALKRREPVSIDYSLVLGDRSVYFSAVVSPLGEKTVVWVARDITARQEAEQALRRSEELHRVLFDANPLPMWVYDRETLAFLMVNDAAVRHYGYSRDEFLSMTIVEIRPKEDALRLRAAVAANAASPHHSVGWRHQRRDGSLIDVEIAAHPIMLDGRPAELVLAHDVTERLRVETALREQTALLNTIIESSPLATITLDTSFRITRWNPAAEALLGWPEAEIAGREISVIMPDERRDEHLALRARVLAGERITIETQRCHRDGGRVDVALSIALLPDDAGGVHGFVAIMADISERKRLEAELVHSRKMEAIGSLAGGIAHDFNNLITVINSYASFLVEALAGQPLAEDAEEVCKAGERAASLTHQLLAFSRRQVLQPQPIQLNALVHDMQRMLGRIIGETIRFESQLAHDLPVVYADPGQLQQVIMNLVVNARDAMPSGGTVRVETWPVTLHEPWERLSAGNYVGLSVIDTGVGMDAVTMERIFDPYFTTKAVGKGTGLGLATVYGIVQQSGGRIRVQSRPMEGTRFDILLPSHEDAPQAESTAAMMPEPRMVEGRRVLLVEDDGSVRQVARRALAGQGLDVVEVASAEEALEFLVRSGGAADVLVTDMVMPGMGGGALVSEVAERFPAIRILMMSGHTEESVQAAEELPGAARFLEKPFTPASLRRSVEELLG